MPKLSTNQIRRVEEIQQFLKTVDHVKRLVAELEANRAAKSMIIGNICASIARELAQMRQRALTANVGTIADVAGSMSIMAARTGGLQVKLRGLTDGVASLTMQLDLALKQAATPQNEQSS
jgi:hypothetical protein